MILASARTRPERGDIEANLNDTDPGILLVKKTNGIWTGHTIKYE